MYDEQQPNLFDNWADTSLNLPIKFNEMKCHARTKRTKKVFNFQFGAFIVYFFDYTIGCGWWLMLLYAMLMFAVFVIRGKPYTGEHVATLLLKPERLQEQVDEVRQKVCCCCASCIIPLLAFSWTVVSFLFLKMGQPHSVTRLGDLLDFGQLFKAFGNN